MWNVGINMPTYLHCTSARTHTHTRIYSCTDPSLRMIIRCGLMHKIHNIQLTMIKNIIYLKFPPNSNIYTTANLYYTNTKTSVNTKSQHYKCNNKATGVCIYSALVSALQHPLHLDRFWSFLQHSNLYANSSMVLPVITMPKVAKLTYQTTVCPDSLNFPGLVKASILIR